MWVDIVVTGAYIVGILAGLSASGGMSGAPSERGPSSTSAAAADPKVKDLLAQLEKRVEEAKSKGQAAYTYTRLSGLSGTPGSTSPSTDPRVPLRICGTEVKKEVQDVYGDKLRQMQVPRLEPDNLLPQSMKYAIHMLMRCPGFVVQVMQHYQSLGIKDPSSPSLKIIQFFHDYLTTTTAAALPDTLVNVLMTEVTPDIPEHIAMDVFLQKLGVVDNSLQSVIPAIFNSNQGKYVVDISQDKKKDNKKQGSGPAVFGGVNNNFNFNKQLLQQLQQQNKNKNKNKNNEGRGKRVDLSLKLRNISPRQNACYVLVNYRSSGLVQGQDVQLTEKKAGFKPPAKVGINVNG
jgi:hypothetical protein